MDQLHKPEHLLSKVDQVDNTSLQETCHCREEHKAACMVEQVVIASTVRQPVLVDSAESEYK